MTLELIFQCPAFFPFHTVHGVLKAKILKWFAIPFSSGPHSVISRASKVMLKILPARLQQYVNHELPDVQEGFKKGRGTRDQIANIRWIMKKEESLRKSSISALLTMPNPLTVWITINCGKF